MPARASLASVVRRGDYRASLEALRDHMAGDLDAGNGNAATAKQLTEVLRLLEALPSGKERTIDDELADRRAARGEDSEVRVGAEVAGRSGGRRRRSGRGGGSGA